ncbi:helix-turn-helix transcriptional regulator [Pseudonocardia sp. GCM10023141]|uniref:helix-turn-helix transcriptional regulator n=1 Tax=Pseudonocardia sp. GCM10023141 TaxID=3252653 RepID=UPI0036076784
MEPRFVGRSAELDELVGRFEDALAGRPGVALVAGEPGIGKTRLVAEVCRIAGSRAVPALWGTCTDEEGAPAYWPWRRILRSWIAAAGPEAVLPEVAAELVRIAPELRTSGAVPPGPAGPEQRFAAFDAAASFFTEAAAPGGLVLVLDDAQWADPASLALLGHVARHARDARLLLAVTYRPRELGDDPARTAAVADLARLPGTVRLELRGLDEHAVAAALTDRLGRRPSAEVVATVVRRSRGNPFFVGELGRVLANPGATGDQVPGAVRDAVRRRLDRLPPASRTVLDVAAVIGREFDLEMLAGAAGVSAETLLDELEPALADGLLDRPRGSTALRFGHDLVRETLLVELAPAQRTRVHHRIVALLEPMATDPDVAPELAHHALAALPLGSPAAAVGWARTAAEQAMAQLAHEEAARLYTLAVDAGRSVLPAAARAELLIAAAHAYAAANAVATTTELCTEAADLARHIGDPQLLGRAALVMPGVSDLTWLAVSRQWCEEALRDLAPADSPLRARLLAQLCHAMVVAADHDGMDDASARALAMAERLGDRESLVSALRARQLARSSADGNAERAALGGRMLALGESTGDADAALWGRIWRFDAFLQAGRIADAELELDRVEPVVARLRLPLARLHLIRSRAALAFGRGQYADATRLNDEAMRIAEDGQHSGALLTATAVRFTLRMFTGSNVEVDALESMAEHDSPFVALVRSWLAQWLMAVGRLDAAHRWYARLPPPGSRRLLPFMVMPVLTHRALLATDLGDAASAEVCYRLLLPHADLHGVGGAGAVTTGGSVQLYLGTAALGAGRPEPAVRHLRAAIIANEAVGFVPFAAMSRYRLAAALRARGRPADSDEAVALLAAADTVADRIGMAPLRAQIARLAGQVRDGGVLTHRETEIAELVGRGLTNRQVAASTHISERTVESHVQHILAKLGFSSRSQIAAWSARRTG